MNARSLDRMFSVLVLWTVLTGIFAWLPLVRILGRPDGYTWGVLGLGGAGTEGPFWVFILATAWVVSMLWTLVRGPRSVSYVLVVGWHLLITGIVIAGTIAGGTDATIQGQGLRWEIPLWVLTVPFLIGTSMAAGWAVVDARSGSTPVAAPWAARNTVRLGVSLGLLALALLLFRAGTNYDWVTAAAIVVTVLHWVALVRAFGDSRPGGTAHSVSAADVAPRPATPPAGGPVTDAERIDSLDVLRGVAVLGILAMNIGSFAMPSAAYQNPTVWGSLNGLNGVVWTATHLLVDLKFMAIFSMLFGAGLVLMSERRESRGEGVWGLHLRRMFWLLVFGLAHAHLIWYGDILVWYAVTGTLVFGLRRRRPRTLIALGLGAWLVGSMILTAAGLSWSEWPEAERVETVAELDPPAEVLQAEVEAYRGGFGSQLEERSPTALEMETGVYLVWALWRVSGLMLLGMAFFKLGVLSASRSDTFYRRLLVAAALVGIPVVAAGIAWNRSTGWEPPGFFFIGSLPNYWGSLPVALGWVGLVMLAVRRGWWDGLRARFAAVGRMAFTNYIAQSVICTWIFYGHGLGLFGRVDRVGQVGIMLAVWAVMLAVSPLWLRRFRFGPLEWLWRSLVYRRLQPMRRG
jgi:uncharacterized protein